MRKTKKNHALQRSASTLTSASTNSTRSTFSRIWGSFRRSHSSHSVSDGFKPLDRLESSTDDVLLMAPDPHHPHGHRHQHHVHHAHGGGGGGGVEIIKSISELDNSVVSFNHGNVETIPPGESHHQ